MKSFNEYITEADVSPAQDKKMRDHVYHNVLNTDKTHDQVKKEFVKKFGAHNVKHFERHVSNAMDM